MYYAFPLTLPPNTTKAQPIEQVLNLTWGVITHVAIRFPLNCAGQAKVMILEHRHQLWPSNLDDWFYGDDETVSWAEYHEVFNLPARFTLIGYNTDDRFTHIPIIRLAILHPDSVLRASPGGLTTKTRRIAWETINAS